MEKVLGFIVLFFVVHPTLSTATVVDLLEPDCNVRALMSVLESREPVKSDFVELRSNPFQKRPRRFEGTIYWHPDHGLSLEYRSPASTKINVDRKSIIIFREGDDPRVMMMTEENPALEMFLKLFDWDTRWIADHFTTEAEFSETEAELRLTPVEQQIRNRLNQIVLRISDNVLNSIELDLSGQKEILIRLTGQEIPWITDRESLSNRYGTIDEGS